MKNFIVSFLLSLILFYIPLCNAKELSSDQKIFYSKLRKCEKYSDSLRIIYGFEGNYCKLAMIIPEKVNNRHIIWIFKYPRSILNSLVNDAMTLSDKDLSAKWEQKIESYFVRADWK